MLASLIVVAVKATYDIGGLEVVVDRNLKGERLELPM